MIHGIGDLDFNDARRLLDIVIERTIEEQEALQKEYEEKKIEILMHEYMKRLDTSRHAKHEKDQAIHDCNKRMEKIEGEIFDISNKRSYFEVQREKLCKTVTLNA